MNPSTRPWLLWAPRLLGLLVCAYLSLFALDVFNGHGAADEIAVALVRHLIPTAVLLAVVAAAWRWEWIGAVVFIGVAAMYAWSAAPRHLDWVAVISGPLLVVGIGFLWSWRHHDELRAAR